MTALIVIGSVLLFLTFLLTLSAKVTIAYDKEVTLWVKVLFVKLRLIPKEKKNRPHSMSKRKAEKVKKKLEKKRAKKLEKKRAKAERKKTSKEGGAKKEKKSLSEILDVIDLSKQLLGAIIKRFFKHLRIHAVRVNIRIAMGDAASTAIAYGAVTQAINLTLPLLDSIKTVKLPKEKDINIEADFLSEESEIDICFSFKLRVWHLLHVAIAALITFIKHKIKSFDKKEDESPQSSEIQKANNN